MSQKKINQNNLLYNLLRPFVNYNFLHFYRKVEYRGIENVPENAGVIFAPNHCNALMDPLAILAMNREAKVFVARADLFRNKRIAKILSFLKIMPVLRMRDGYENLKKSNDTADRAVEVLKEHTPFCIFPEAAHQVNRTLLPLTKGIFRIALQAQREMSEPLYIVPVGLNYESFFHSRSKLLVNFGEPMPVKPYTLDESLSEAEVMNVMRDDCTVRMRALLHYIERDDDLEPLEEFCAVRLHEGMKQAGKPMSSLYDQLLVNRETMRRVESLKEVSEERYSELVRDSEIVRSERLTKGIALESVMYERGVMRLVAGVLVLLVTLPYTLVMGVLFGPLDWLTGFLTKKVMDPVFGTSIRYVLQLIPGLVLLIIYALIGFVVLPLGWAMGWLVALMPAVLVVQEARSELRKLISDVRLRRDKLLQKRISLLRGFNLD